VHLSIFISVFNQPDVQNLFHSKFYFMPLHVSSISAHHQEVNIALHSLWCHHTYRWPSCARDGHPLAGIPPLIGCPLVLIEYIRIYPPYWRMFLHPQPEDLPCHVDRDPLIMDRRLIKENFYNFCFTVRSAAIQTGISVTTSHLCLPLNSWTRNGQVNLGSVSSPLSLCETWKLYIVKYNRVT